MIVGGGLALALLGCGATGESRTSFDLVVTGVHATSEQTVEEGGYAVSLTEAKLYLGTITFYAAKSHRYTGNMKMQVSSDGATWNDTGWSVDGYGSGDDGNTEMPTKIVWYPQGWDVNLVGQYSIRWIMHDNRGTSGTKFFIDDIQSVATSGVGKEWEVYR